MKIIFIGAVESSYIFLETLLEKQIKIEKVFTIFDNKYNSDYRDLRPLCQKYNVEVVGIKNINDEENIKIIKEINPDFIFVIGISQLIKKEIINIPKFGCIGLHPSLLPKNRGRAVLPWTILNEEKETGLTLFKIDEGTDSGDILVQEKIKISEREDSNTLYQKILLAIKKVIEENIENILTQEITYKKQLEEEATYCAIRTMEDGEIDWNKSAKDIDKLIRATTKPYPGAYTYHKGEKLIIWTSEIVEKDNWSALSGQRVEILKGQGVKVKTGNGILLIKDIEYKGQQLKADNFFKIVGKKF